MSKLAKFLSLANPSELCSDHFPGWLKQPRGINKDPTIRLDEARSLPKYVFKNNVSATNTEIWTLNTQCPKSPNLKKVKTHTPTASENAA
jgi:hypothetical protein